MKKEKIKIEKLVDLSLLTEGQLQCLAEEFEKIVCDFYKFKADKKPP